MAEGRGEAPERGPAPAHGRSRRSEREACPPWRRPALFQTGRGRTTLSWSFQAPTLLGCCGVEAEWTASL